jgi:membrane protein YqaA with SNARE-associated domain
VEQQQQQQQQQAPQTDQGHEQPVSPKWVRWVRKASAHRTFPFYACGIVVADFFFPILPSTALVVSASLIAPRKWISIALGCAFGSAIGAFIIATIFYEYGWLVIEWLFGDLKSAPQWQTIEWAIQTYGIFALLLISALPMPLRVPTLITALAGLPAVAIALTILIGRIIGYGLLANLASKSPQRLLKIPFLRKSRVIRSLLGETK